MISGNFEGPLPPGSTLVTTRMQQYEDIVYARSGDLPCDPGVCCCAGSRADSARGLLGLDSKPLSLSLSLPRSVGSFLQRAVLAASRDTIESRLTVNFLQATRVMVPALSGTPGEHQSSS